MSPRRYLPGFAAVAVLVSTIALSVPKAPALAQQEPQGVVLAGYGQADATWHVGAGAGQHADKSTPAYALEPPGGPEDVDPREQEIDPHGHSTTQKDSYGVQSRLSYRAIVVQDKDGDQVAFVKSDNYLAQDYLTRRVGQLLEEAESEISYDEIFQMASHNHSSPYYTTPSWGVWAFQDAFDLRAFEYHARTMAEAILKAEDALAPAKMGATTIQHYAFKGIIQRAGISDDGSPRGYPRDGGDHGLTVIRFDALPSEKLPEGGPIATMINWGQHPEGLDGHDLITGDYIAPLERFIERATGAPLVFGQGDVGSSEQGPGIPSAVPDGIPKQWNHAGHAQGERGAFLLAQDAIKAWDQIGEGDALVPFSSDFEVAAGNAFVPGPVSHPYPSYSNCRTHQTVEGNPGAFGLPHCTRPQEDQTDFGALDPLFETLKAHGIPVPETYGPAAFSGVEENMRLKLQAFKMGEVILASCACEAQWDLIANLESRLDDVENNIWEGFDWRTRMDCTKNGDTWTCSNFQDDQTISFSEAAYQRMDAQIHNDAGDNGDGSWNDRENVVAANAEPSDPSKIWGNFTHEELPVGLGYTLPVGVGHASDYNGYTVSYREYMSWDDYRKALTSYGPHTADYMNMWLQDLAESLQPTGAPLPTALNDDQAQADEARQQAFATALGRASEAAYDAWVASMPNDAGVAEALTLPEDIQKFEAATFTWRGGSNAVDNPVVRVQRQVGTDDEGKPAWVDFADQSGEVQTMLDFPNGADAIIDTYAGNQEWLWTANFEAFDAFPIEIGSTPLGTYRFVVEGHIRQANLTETYEIVSESFDVRPWDGVQVSNFKTDAAGDVTFQLPELYPDTYDSLFFPYITTSVMKGQEGGGPQFCAQCSFRPWATKIDYSQVIVTVERADGSVEKVIATFHPKKDGEPSYWSADTNLGLGDLARIESGEISDVYGERNTEGTSAVFI